MIPYGKQIIDDDDIAEVIEVLKSDWLTTGPKVSEFENNVAGYIGCKNAIAVSSGTAALHAVMHALKIKAGDEVILPPITFLATANCVAYMGGTPVFADINPDTLLIDPASVERKITPATKAVIAVDYAGQTCDYNILRSICSRHNLALVADCCHALGAKDPHDRNAGSIADISVLSFHPVKHITTGEGGMILTDNNDLAQNIRSFRNHGINLDASARQEECTWNYEMQDLGYNYRITDLQCALGISQLRKLDIFLEKRRTLAAVYDSFFKAESEVSPLKLIAGATHAYHLYVIKIPAKKRKKIFEFMRNAGIGVNVHYIPVHCQPYYKKIFGTYIGMCPAAEEAYEQLLTLPLHPAMTEKDVKFIVSKLNEALSSN
ncbi:UDP-4-amino-4,6-dideoxy-N-acetyl-beta-L-altrosamine transaminase [Maridesulfovibrio zosterae]|uniref:UDP-4-amino-4, 6-dideoxy-N-acetyl-beta-L-altrosamine transaminase n=1 Tax=Maridesulfovibrio zosterae TaxID=82171 RepID=UPI00041A9A10|nr:UDP-4-amino-4,6-dideoxy-N-acetyl-beta-L-altrosamine transaminase [Maridesulfovibrio zosterae]